MGKRLISILLAGALTAACCVCGAVFASANDTDGFSEGLAFKVSDTEATLTGIGTCADTALVIPSTVEGKPVTAIADEAFMKNSTLTSLVVPSSVSTIGERAFAETALESVTLAEGLQTIGNCAFYEVMNLTAVTLPASLKTLEEFAFEGCDALAAVTVLSADVTINEDAIPASAAIIAPAGSTAVAYATATGNTLLLPSAFSVGTDSVRATAGKTFSVPIRISDNPGFNYLKLSVSYPDTLFALTGVEAGTLFADGLFGTSKEITENPYILVFGAAGNVSEDGVLCTLTFTVEEDAVFSDEMIGITVVECRDEDDGNVTLEIPGGAIHALWYTPGDITDDGAIGGTDLTHLLQYLAEWEDVDIVPEAADVNADGTVDGLDATLLLQYLAEWDVTLGEPQS